MNDNMMDRGSKRDGSQSEKGAPIGTETQFADMTIQQMEAFVYASTDPDEIKARISTAAESLGMTSDNLEILLAVSLPQGRPIKVEITSPSGPCGGLNRLPKL